MFDSSFSISAILSLLNFVLSAMLFSGFGFDFSLSTSDFPLPSFGSDFLLSSFGSDFPLSAYDAAEKNL